MNPELYTGLITFIRGQVGRLASAVSFGCLGIVLAVTIQTCHVTESEKALQGIREELHQMKELVRSERCPR